MELLDYCIANFKFNIILPKQSLEIDNGLIVTELPYFRRAPVNLPASNARRVSELP